MLQRVDGFFQVGIPVVYASDVIVVWQRWLYLLLRRMREPMVRYISLFTDYFALFLLLGIALSGVLMRHATRVDVAAIKQFALGLATFHPVDAADFGPGVHGSFAAGEHAGGVFSVQQAGAYGRGVSESDAQPGQ